MLTDEWFFMHMSPHVVVELEQVLEYDVTSTLCLRMLMPAHYNTMVWLIAFVSQQIKKMEFFVY